MWSIQNDVCVWVCVIQSWIIVLLVANVLNTKQCLCVIQSGISHMRPQIVLHVHSQFNPCAAVGQMWSVQNDDCVF